MSPLTASANNALPTYIRQDAHLDIFEAYTYYEEKLPGLGERFLPVSKKSTFDLQYTEHLKKNNTRNI